MFTKFLNNSDWWRTSRPVWEGEVATPQPGSAETPAAKPVEAPKTAEQVEAEKQAAAKAQQAQGAERVAAAQAVTAEAEQSGKEADAVANQLENGPMPKDIFVTGGAQLEAKAQNFFATGATQTNPNKTPAPTRKYSEAQYAAVKNEADKNPKLAEAIMSGKAEEITSLVTAGEIPERMGDIAKEMLEEAKPTAEQPTVTSAPAVSGAETPATETPSGGGGTWDKIVDLLTKIADKLGAFLASISGTISRLFKSESPEKKFNKNPFGDKTPTVKTEYKEGAGIVINLAKDSEIKAPDDGTVKFDSIAKKVQVTKADGTKITYTNANVAPGIIEGADIKAGSKIATVAGDEGLRMQLFDKDDKEKDPTDWLKPYVTTAATPAEAGTSSGSAEQTPSPSTPAEKRVPQPGDQDFMGPPVELAGPGPASEPTMQNVPPYIPPKNGESAPKTEPVPNNGEKVQIELASNDAQTLYKNAVREQLKDKMGKEFSTSTPIDFKLPFLSGAKIELADCRILGNKFTVAGKNYKVDMPMGAELQKIKFEGSVENGMAVITAGLGFITQEGETTIPELLSTLEALRTKTDQNPLVVKVGANEVKFTATQA